MIETFRPLNQLGLVFDEREYSGLDWGNPRMEPKDSSFFSLDFVYLIGRAKNGKKGSIDPQAWLDYVGQIFGFEGFVEVLEVFSRMLLVLAQVKIPPGGNSFQFMLPERKLESDVRTCLSVMGKLFLGVYFLTQKVFRQAYGAKPCFSGIDPFPVIPPPLLFARRDEILDFHLLEFTRSENEISRGNLVSKGFPDLGNAKGDFDPTGIHDVFEIRKDSLGGFRPKITKRGPVAQGSDVSLEHHVEFPGGSKRTRLAGSWRRNLGLLS